MVKKSSKHKRQTTIETTYRKIPTPAGPQLIFLAVAALLVLTLGYKLLRTGKEEKPGYENVASIEKRPEAPALEALPTAKSPAPAVKSDSWMNEIERELLPKLPGSLQRRANVNFRAGNMGIWKAQIEIDGVPVSYGEFSLENLDGKWSVVNGEMPPLPSELAYFPKAVPNYESQLLRDLEASESDVEAIHFREKVWVRSDDGTYYPGALYEVDFKDNTGTLRKETWALHASSGEVKQRYSRVRH
jgi:hypothetical protein